jgi:hypothetical protein
MSQEELSSKREIAQDWWTKNGTRVKDFLKAYNALSATPPIADSKIIELHTSGLEALRQEAKIVATQVIAYEHVWHDWNKEICDKMYKEGMEIENALSILGVTVNMAARAVGARDVAGGWQREPWGPHLPLNVECILSSSYHTFKDQRWRHLWEEDRRKPLGGNRNERMDAIIEAEEDAAALTMTEQQLMTFQLRRATDRKDAAWRSWNREKEAVEQGIGSVDRVAAAKATWDQMEREFDVVQLRWVKMRS